MHLNRKYSGSEIILHSVAERVKDSPSLPPTFTPNGTNPTEPGDVEGVKK